MQQRSAVERAIKASARFKLARKIYWGVQNFSLPIPMPLAKLMCWIYVGLRSVFFFLRRTLICEPIFNAYCSSYGKNLHTGVFIHWVQGMGSIVVGNDVTIDGKCSFAFARRFSDDPTLRIGDGTGIGHGCAFTVGKGIVIGRHCRIAPFVTMFDSNGHPSDPAARLHGDPPRPEDVRPITVEDNVWIGIGSFIFPGVTIGEGSVVSAGSIVSTHVAPYTIVAGNPARRIGTLERPPSPEEGLSSDEGNASHTLEAK